MTIAEFYNHPEIIGAYGPGRTRRVVSQLREVWPEFIGEDNHRTFPTFYKPVNNYQVAWLVFVLTNCRSATKENVIAAILRGRELKCDGENFIVWFGNLLSDPDNLDSIKNIFIFDGLSCVHVTPNTYAGYTHTKIFQGKRPVSHIGRAAILDREFLKEIAELIHAQCVAEDQENWDSQGDGYSCDD